MERIVLRVSYRRENTKEMNRYENTSRMEFGSSQSGSDEKEMYLRMSPPGHKRSTRDRTPEEVNSDEEIDTPEEADVRKRDERQHRPL